MQREIWSFIEPIINYIDENDREDYFDEAIILNKIVDEFWKILKGEKVFTLNKLDFISRLTRLEISIYTKKNRTITNITTFQNMSKRIDDKLKFLGFSDTSINADTIILKVEELIKKILSLPYVGCEEDIIELFKIALEYKKELKKTFASRERSYNDVYKETSQVLESLKEKVESKISAFVEESIHGTVGESVQNSSEGEASIKDKGKRISLD